MSEAKLFRRSIGFVESWIAELAPKPKPTKAPAAAKPEKKPKGAAAPAAADGSSLSKVSFQVGRVIEVAEHPESEKLYVEKVDLGEESGPRTILSGLRAHVTKEEFLNRMVVVVANLDARKIAGIPSHGMVLCASTADKAKTELLSVPEDTPLGERIIFPGHDQPAEPVLKKKLAKHWEETMPKLNTGDDGLCRWEELAFTTSKGPITSNIKGGILS